MKERRSQRSSSAKAASTNAMRDTVDASGDLLREGDQSLNFNAARHRPHGAPAAGRLLDLVHPVKPAGWRLGATSSTPRATPTPQGPVLSKKHLCGGLADGSCRLSEASDFDKETPLTRSGGAEFWNTNHWRALRAFLRPFAFGECVAPAIRKSSIFFPVLIAAANHRGFNPRPAHVSLGF
jgi:hypothetical protein